MPTAVSELLARVNYSETDQMGVVYHGRYVVWLDMARTEHLRLSGMTYRELEERGFFLVVGELNMRFRQPARYDDVVRVRCWVRDVASRRVTFGYALEEAESGRLLVTAETRMMCLNRDFAPTRLPDDVMTLLPAVSDPVRI